MNGSTWSVSMQTPATMICEPVGAASISFCSMPGTPTHSKMIARLTAWPPMRAMVCSKPVGSTPTSRHLSCGDSLDGSTITSAPIFSAMRRRAGEKSAAMTGP